MHGQCVHGVCMVCVHGVCMVCVHDVCMVCACVWCVCTRCVMYVMRVVCARDRCPCVCGRAYVSCVRVHARVVLSLIHI